MPLELKYLSLQEKWGEFILHADEINRDAITGYGAKNVVPTIVSGDWFPGKKVLKYSQ